MVILSNWDGLLSSRKCSRLSEKLAVKTWCLVKLDVAEICEMT